MPVNGKAGRRNLAFTRGIRIDEGPTTFHSDESNHTPPISMWSVDGRDFLGLRPAFLVAENDRIEQGQPLLHDRRRPELIIVSPASGRVAQAVRRSPESGAFKLTVHVETMDDDQVSIDRPRLSRDSVRACILRHGLWPAIRQRPHGLVADPAIAPATILVCATAADPLAPDPLSVVESDRETFEAGIRALGLLSDGDVVVTQPRGPLLADDAILVDGPFPAGLAGTQIHALRLAAADQPVWWLNYQEAMTIGRVFSRAAIAYRRIVAIAGPVVGEARLVSAPPGAALADLVQWQPGTQGGTWQSGPLIGGRGGEFLGRHDLQVSFRPAKKPAPVWWKRTEALFAGRANTQRPIVPIAAHDKSFPFDIPVVPFLRALATGDAETVVAMGGLDLIEEDMAILSHVCPSGQDYGALLRLILDDVRRSG